jgi:8-oxo-dGTP pyrophosphatase MutT (NUDIX family)
VVLLDEDGRVLLFKLRNAKSGGEWWATPGGGLEPGEKSIDGARRELREETGLDLATLEGPVWEADHWFRSGADVIHQRERFFLGRTNNFAPARTGLDRYEAEMMVDARWWSTDELAAADERVFPRGLAGLLTDLAASGVPAKPVKLAR